MDLPPADLERSIARLGLLRLDDVVAIAHEDFRLAFADAGSLKKHEYHRPSSPDWLRERDDLYPSFEHEHRQQEQRDIDRNLTHFVATQMDGARANLHEHKSGRGGHRQLERDISHRRQDKADRTQQLGNADDAHEPGGNGVYPPYALAQRLQRSERLHTPGHFVYRCQQRPDNPQHDIHDFPAAAATPPQ